MRDFNNDNIDKIMNEYISSVKKGRESSVKLSDVGIFLLAFFATILVLSIILWTGGVDGISGNAQLTQGNTEYIQRLSRPGAEQRLNVLMAVAQDKNTAPEIYLLLGYMPDRGYITVSAFPHITYVAANRSANTLEDCYKSAGMSYTAKALGDFLNINIPYYISMTHSDINSVIDSTGRFNYEVVRTLDYQHGNRHIRLEKGVREIDARAIVDIMTYPQYKGAEQERSDLAALVSAATLNDILLKYRNDSRLDLRSLLFENSDTSISGTVLEQRKDSFSYLLSADDKFVIPTFLEGELSQDYSMFIVADGAVDRLSSIYS